MKKLKVIMVLENEYCTVSIEIDESYTVGSADNRYYDTELNCADYKRGDLTKTLAVRVDLFSREYSVAVIASCYVSETECAVLEGDVLTVLADSTVAQIRVTDGSVIRRAELDFDGCSFAIYKTEKGFIIYGEQEIALLDFDLVKKWTFIGKDVFVSVCGRCPFEIKEDTICLRDFEDNYYELDFDGKRIK